MTSFQVARVRCALASQSFIPDTDATRNAEGKADDLTVPQYR